MRKNSIRKFVHAILDLIPLFIIPIFAIYTRNENYNSNIEIEVQEKVSVNFNQLYKLNREISNNSFDFISNEQFVEIEFIESSYYICNFLESNLKPNNKYYLTFNDYNQDTQPIITFRMVFTINNSSVYQTWHGEDIFEYPSNSTMFSIMFDARNNYYSGTYPLNISGYINLYNLTQMYGVGNEPTIQEFKSIFTNVSYEYTESQKMLVNKPSPTTYNDTDIGSQFVYTLYNATDKYFNMNNVFNMRDVYDWFVLNIFGGNAPLGLYIVWNIVLYEFVMDLLMLLYCVFMFFIDCCTKLIEKPLNAIK